jgi:predicted  nucleic acid-binding Zn-ribbon protein
MADKDYTTVLLEEIRDQNKVLIEGQKDLPTRWEFDVLRRDVEAMKQNITVLKVAIADLSEDVKVIKAGVTDNSRELADHEHRIARLEAA